MEAGPIARIFGDIILISRKPLRLGPSLSSTQITSGELLNQLYNWKSEPWAKPIRLPTKLSRTD